MHTYFTERLIKLLLVQQGKISRSAIGLENHSSDWQSAGSVLASEGYKQHVEEELCKQKK